MFTKFKQAKSENLLLIISLALVAFPHFLRMPVLISLLCILVITWRLFYEVKNILYPGKLVRFILLLVGVGTVLFSYQTLVGRHAGTALLVLMLCLKLTEFKNKRDAVVIIFLGYFVVITGFLFSQSIPVAIYMLLTVILLTTTLVAFQHKARSQMPHVKLASRMILYSLPLAGVLFVLFPRVPGPLWGLPEDAYNAKTGISDTMSPGLISSLASSNEVAFRVKFTKNIPASEYRYWRGPVFWFYNGRAWNAPGRRRLKADFINYQALSDPLSYAITLQPHQQHWAFALDIPAQIPQQAFITPDLQMMFNKKVTETLRYQLTSYTNYYLPRYTSVSFDRYLELPGNISPKSRSLVKQWQHQNLSKEQIVDKALNYFANNEFYYSRKSPLLFDDPVDEFLFETKKGYCEHYSSAFTVLMRMAGIPARVVTGYYGGELNPLGEYMIIRQSDAHAWSEVFLQHKGWIRIDPTAVIPPSRIEAEEDIVRIKPESNQAITITRKTSWLTRSLRGVRYTLDSINNTWSQWVIGYNNKKQSAIFNAFGIPEITWKGLSTIMFFMLTIMLTIFSFYIFGTRIKNDPISKIYLRFCQKAARKGLQKQDSETASQFAKRVIDLVPDKKLAIMKITTMYNNLRYGKSQSRSLIKAFSENVKNLKL